MSRFLSLATVTALLAVGCTTLATAEDAPPSPSRSTDGATPVSSAEGSPTGDRDGGAGEVPAAPVTGVACPAFEACAGSLVGTWEGEAACTAGLFSWFDRPPTSGCADFKETKVTGTVKARYTFTEVNVTRSLEGKIVETIDLPLRCTGKKTCADVQANIVTSLFGEHANPYPNVQAYAASCTEPTTDTCRCDVTLTLTHAEEDFTQGYELQSASHFEQADGTGGAFCPSGDTLALQTTVQGLGSIFPDEIVYTLRKVK